LDLWKIRQTGNVDVPYWDVKVDPSIIKDHGDIWNPKAQAMMAAIFRMTNPLMNRSSQVRPRAVLKKEPTRPVLVPSGPDQSHPKVKTESAPKPAPSKRSPKPQSEPPIERTR
jgi:hypothetical protein